MNTRYMMASPPTTRFADVVPEDRLKIFHHFPRLPPELRRTIWREYLTDETPPQMYRFTLWYVKQLEGRATYGLLGRNPEPLQPVDRLFLRPIKSISSTEDKYYLQPLRESTIARHTASKTCVQSREAVLEMYPDTLLFGHFPPHRDSYVDQHDSSLQRPDGASFPGNILRFNSAKDIIVFHADWDDQEAAVQIAQLKRSPPEEFLKIRHVGIAVDNFSRLRHMLVPAQYGTSDCTCSTAECQDHCKKEPLLNFLSLFPLIETFYVASVPSFSTHQPADHIRAGKEPSREVNCPCPKDEPRHSWPMIKSADACGWFAIYDERSTCHFPKLCRVWELRQTWRRHFPYYRALSHLTIKFIQLWDPELATNSPPCIGCIYT